MKENVNAHHPLLSGLVVVYGFVKSAERNTVMNKEIEVNWKMCTVYSEEEYINGEILYKKITYIHKSNGRMVTKIFRIGEEVYYDTKN